MRAFLVLGVLAGQTVPPRPAARSGHALVYDLRREAVVLVNGDHVGADAKQGEAWAWDGKVWNRIDSSGPPPRTLSGVTYDRKRKALVLQGGLGAGDGPESRFGDTWTWDGAKWTRAKDAGPGSRNHHALAFDEKRGVVVLFGGQDEPGHNFGDTWEWDGKSWKKVATTGPPARVHHALVWDGARERVLVFGGTDGKRDLGDFWAWDGKAWSEIEAPGPPARSHPRMAFHAGHESVYLVGGDMNDATVWTWDGKAWSKFEGDAPPARVVHALAYDEARERLVLFGGYSGGNRNLDDTWELVEDRWVQVEPAPAR